MNEILFENRYVRDENTAKEIFGYHYFRRPIVIAFCILFGLYTISNVVGLIVESHMEPSAIFSLVLLVIIIVTWLASYKTAVRTMVKRDKEAIGDAEFEITVTADENKISITTPVSNQSVNFENVKHVFKTKNYVAVVTKASLIYILKKDSFVKGDAESFFSFLMSKGIKIK